MHWCANILPETSFPVPLSDQTVHDGLAAGDNGRIDVIVLRHRSFFGTSFLPCLAEVLRTIADLFTRLEGHGIERASNYSVSRRPWHSGIVYYPVLDVPAILEERPHHVLEIDVRASLNGLGPCEESPRAVQLVNIGIMACKRLNVPHHRRRMIAVAIAATSSAIHSQPRRALLFGNGSATCAGCASP